MNHAAIRATLTVKVVYLARLREAFGTAAESLSLRGESGAVTVNDVIAALEARGGSFGRELAQGRAFRVAVNHAIVSRDMHVQQGDEVAFLPPVTGG